MDALEEGEQLFPIQYKKGQLKEKESDDVQLCAEAMILEENLNKPMQRGYIHYMASNARREVIFTEQLREKVIATAQRAWDILQSEVVPEPVADRRCVGCSLIQSCLPMEVKFLEGEAGRPQVPSLKSDALARVLYIDEQGAKISKVGSRIAVTKDGSVLAQVPVLNVDQIVLAGNVQMTTQTIRFLLKSNVEVVYLNSYGKFEGRFVPETHKNAMLRVDQFGVSLNKERCLALSKSFVTGKLHNQKTILFRFARSRADAEVASAGKEIDGLMRQLGGASSKAEVMGIEGAAARTYFEAFGKLIAQANFPFDFEKRTRRPPKDPVNCLLSFGYSLLVSDAISAASVAGFDPFIGFFHELRYGRPALALDLMEEFRPLFVDALVIWLITKGVITANDFQQRMGAWFLTEPGRERFFKAYSNRKRQMVTHPIFGYQVPGGRLIELQARLLSKYVRGEIDAYLPYKAR